MDFKNWLFTEMPISKFEFEGEWEPKNKRAYGWSRKDMAILTNPNAIKKIHKKWSNTLHSFDLYFVKSKIAYQFKEVGEVTPEWVKKRLQLDIDPNPGSITVIFTQNTGNEKIPMTAWAIAHRMAHSIKNEQNFKEKFFDEVKRDFEEILTNVYLGNFLDTTKKERYLKYLAYEVGTMRSTRQKKLVTFYEFIHELVAQFIITGRIKFNPLPSIIKSGGTILKSSISDYELKEWNFMLQNHSQKYELTLDDSFSRMEGKMFLV